jgi:glycosyltransferase involved in cell wall biosynthesis
VHGYGHAFVDLAAFTLARYRMPFVFTLHGIPTRPARRNRVIRMAFKTYERFGVRAAIRKATAVTAISRTAAGSVAREVKVEIIPNGVSPVTSYDPQRAERMRRRLSIPKSVPVVAAAGRLSVEKGFDVLVKALDQVRIPNLTCVIAGDDGGVGNHVAALASKARAGVSVLLPGRLSRDDVTDLFAIADVVVVPSREESFGLVALEALALGKRLVASRIGGLEEVLSARVAELVPRDSVADLASAIDICLARGPLNSSELAAARNLVASHSWSAVALQYEGLMTRVAKASVDTPKASSR